MKKNAAKKDAVKVEVDESVLRAMADERSKDDVNELRRLLGRWIAVSMFCMLIIVAWGEMIAFALALAVLMLYMIYVDYEYEGDIVEMHYKRLCEEYGIVCEEKVEKVEKVEVEKKVAEKLGRWGIPK